LAATDAPGNNSSKLPEASAVVLADQGAPTITLTSVFALLTTGTKEAIMEGEVEAKLGVLQKPLAPLISDDGDINLLEDLLVSTTLEAVLAPTSDIATLTVKLLCPIRKTYRRYVGVLGIIHVAIQPDHGNVIVQVATGEIGVQEDILSVELDMSVEFGIVVDIPLPESDPKIFWSVALDAVSGGKNMRSIDQRTATNVNVVKLLFLQNGNLPWVLSEFGISVDKSVLSDPSVYTLGVLFPALVESSKLVELLLPDWPILARSELVVLATEMASASVMTPMVATVVMALFLFLSIDKCRKTILTHSKLAADVSTSGASTGRWSEAVGSKLPPLSIRILLFCDLGSLLLFPSYDRSIATATTPPGGQFDGIVSVTQRQLAGFLHCDSCGSVVSLNLVHVDNFDCGSGVQVERPSAVVLECSGGAGRQVQGVCVLSLSHDVRGEHSRVDEVRVVFDGLARITDNAEAWALVHRHTVAVVFATLSVSGGLVVMSPTVQTVVVAAMPMVSTVAAVAGALWRQNLVEVGLVPVSPVGRQKVVLWG